MPRLKSVMDAARPAAPWKERERRAQREGLRHLVVSHLGDSYTGEWHADKRHGRGTQVWAQQGLVYDGEWRHGRRCGFGTLSVREAWPGGKGEELVGKGAWPGGKEAGLVEKGEELVRKEAGLVGKGAVQWRRIYSGEWKDGKRHGQGSEFTADCWYEGSWERGERSGWGRARYRNGGLYHGEWRHGEPWGQGVMHYPAEGSSNSSSSSSSSWYEGGWQAGQRHGPGALHVPHRGLVLRGQWRQGQPRCGTWEHEEGAAGGEEEGGAAAASPGRLPFAMPTVRRDA
ncbi:unnamed protein product [Lampetra fluviatilis]